MAARRAAACAILAATLAACGGGGGGEPAGRGAVVYATHCASCHQRDGHGASKNYPTLAGSATVTGDRDTLIAWLVFGQRPATLAPRRGLAVMPQFGWLGDEDLAAVLTHVRSHFGNAASAVTAADVAAVRAAGGSR
jgi:mono/diheme cytochrome c family protein